MQLRTFLAASVIGMSLVCLAGSASAQQVYKWKDAQGVVHFSQTPPTNGVHYSEMHLRGDPKASSKPHPVPNNASGDQPESSAAPQSSDSDKRIADTPANRTTLCKQLDTNIELLTSKQAVVTGDNDHQQLLSDDAREQQLATARAQKAQYCATGGA